MASLMAGIAEVQEVQASGSAQQRCALDFLLFRDIVQDHTAELQQAVLTDYRPVPTAYCGCAYCLLRLCLLWLHLPWLCLLGLCSSWLSLVWLSLPQASAAQYDTDAYGGNGRDEVVPVGLDCLVKGLSTGLTVRLGQAVTAITALQEGGVRVRVAGGEALHADRVIVTVPLGVLKAGGGGSGGGGGGGGGHGGRGGVAFEPAPPQALRDAIDRLGFGEALKVTLRLPTSPNPDPNPNSRCRGASPLAFSRPTTHYSLLITHYLPLTIYYLLRKVALRFPSAFWPQDAHFLGKVGGSTHHCHTHHGSTHRGSTHRGSTHRGSTHRGSTHHGYTRYGDTL